MWAKIEVIPYDNEVIYLPSAFSLSNAQRIEVKFGGRSIDADVEYVKDSKFFEDSTFEKPVRIRMSDRLRDRLLIPETLVYRVKITESGIAFGPVIGLLLGIHTHRYNPKHMKKYSDRMGIYQKVGGLIYAFSPKSINWKKNTAYGLYYNIATSAWEYGCFPLPEVIYRRDFHADSRLIKRLIDYTGNRLFNSYRFSKYELYSFVKENENLRKYLPPTELAVSYEQVRKFIETYPKVILKPIDLSRGRGICVIEKIDSVYKITDYRYKHPIVSALYDNESLEKFFALNQSFFNRYYIIQKYLPLARIGNSLFDVRVVMQKQKDKNWVCSGIECRVSGGNSHLTNISRGGYALTLDEALSRAFGKDYDNVAQHINDFCLEFCRLMDTMGEHFAEFGMDIALDVNKNIWLIESNVFPSFKGFKKTDRQTYLNIRYTPLLYALSLTQFAESP